MIGTLLHYAQAGGLNLAPWRSQTMGAPQVAFATANPWSAGQPPFLQPVRFEAHDLYEPPWIVRGLGMCGDVTVISAPPGGAKTVMSIDLLVAIAAGRSAWGGFPIEPRADGQPHRVLFVSAEEDGGRIGLIVAGALKNMQASLVERSAVKRNFLVHDARESGLRIGTPVPNDKNNVCPEGDDRALHELEANAAGLSFIVLDTLAAILALPNENDNSAATVLMRRLMKMAGRIGCAVILLHHTPKMNTETAAGERGQATAVRGGGAITASARIVWTLTALPWKERGLFAMMGLRPDSIRRLDPVKLNDAPPPAPVLFEVVSASVIVRSGSSVSVRAISFVAMPLTATSAIPTAMLNAAMHAIAAGVTVHGVPGVPLTDASRGNRQAMPRIANALQAADPTLTGALANSAARSVLDHLIGAARCVTVEPAAVPKKPKASGASNGNEANQKGLVAHWTLAPWMTAQAARSAIPSTANTPTGAPSAASPAGVGPPAAITPGVAPSVATAPAGITPGVSGSILSTVTP